MSMVRSDHSDVSNQLHAPFAVFAGGVDGLAVGRNANGSSVRGTHAHRLDPNGSGTHLPYGAAGRVLPLDFDVLVRGCRLLAQRMRRSCVGISGSTSPSPASVFATNSVVVRLPSTSVTQLPGMRFPSAGFAHGVSPAVFAQKTNSSP